MSAATKTAPEPSSAPAPAPAVSTPSKKSEQRGPEEMEEGVKSPEKPLYRGRRGHRRDAEEMIDELDIDDFKKEIISTRWFILKERLMIVKKNSWWKKRAMKVVSIFCTICAPLFILLGQTAYGDPSSGTYTTAQVSSAATYYYVAAMFSFLGAVIVAADAFTRFDHMMEKQVECATTLDRIGWEYISLSGEFSDFDTHLFAFEKFCHITEIEISKLPAEYLPTDYSTAF
ncbi:hypothetical protein TrVE_jg9181 [Triparma verrucosa]|uniref:Uncharacterized protein n=2 Tax=Triparma TaxID=722752 RepID=A0A9W7AQG4_9STRA|nr:hypothetical protein TrST_g10563 [Triparma strigata]GMH99090.1 hypothetical protein TrVE_jg9181 [Triparma verrucosa]